jgi:hypothetical protein
MIAEVARGHMVNGRCDEALDWVARLEVVEPPILWGQYVAAECHAQAGRWEQALAILEVGLTSAGSQRLGTLGQMLGRRHARDSRSSVRRGRRKRARSPTHCSGACPTGRATAFDVATVYVGLGDLDSAFAWLERSFAERSSTFSIMHPAFEEVHRDPRFAAIRAGLGLRRWQPRG